MKRVLFVAAAAVTATCAFAAQPVHAETEASPSGSASLTKVIEHVANEVVDTAVPDWRPRHACLIVDQIDRSWCFTFPFPT